MPTIWLDRALTLAELEDLLCGDDQSSSVFLSVASWLNFEDVFDA